MQCELGAKLSVGTADRRKAISRWLIGYVVACAGLIGAALFAVWAINGFAGLGIGLEGTVALALGIIFSVGLGIGLMALVFQSDRSDHDAVVYRETADEHSANPEDDPSRGSDPR